MNNNRWHMLIALNLTFLAGTWWYSQIDAAPPEANRSFANPIQQRESMIKLLQESNQLLREQNELLKSGKLQVQVTAAR